MRCLVIEDETDTARYIADGLRAAGITATVCRDAAVGLRRVMREHWDVVILDRRLPGEVDGLSVLMAARRSGISTPVLILSALGSPNETVRGLRAGGDGYLAKPFAMAELIARLHV
jgi:two-component system, OmpR family, response regulator